MARKYTGSCACGSVKFEFDTDPSFVAVCHCLDCKKASGGEAATFFGVPEGDFTLVSGTGRLRRSTLNQKYSPCRYSGPHVAAASTL